MRLSIAWPYRRHVGGGQTRRKVRTSGSVRSNGTEVRLRCSTYDLQTVLNAYARVGAVYAAGKILWRDDGWDGSWRRDAISDATTHRLYFYFARHARFAPRTRGAISPFYPTGEPDAAWTRAWNARGDTRGNLQRARWSDEKDPCDDRRGGGGIAIWSRDPAAVRAAVGFRSRARYDWWRFRYSEPPRVFRSEPLLDAFWRAVLNRPAIDCFSAAWLGHRTRSTPVPGKNLSRSKPSGVGRAGGPRPVTPAGGVR